MKKLILTLFLLISSTSLAQKVDLQGPDAVWNWHKTADDLGKVTVITIVSRYTEKESYKVNGALELRLNEKKDFKLFTVIDFVGIPKMFWNFARHRIVKETRHSNADFICDAPDMHFPQKPWREILGADPVHRVDILILDKQGNVRYHLQGSKDVLRAIDLINKMTEEDQQKRSRI